ncbi:unnamed protein product [Somion occarium]|uniref:Postreplication repair E3 ubiquitin-protein ligase RAD18 n=1 Tax=Somion occarium TaxID=3059160 RepID=A0ABP1D6I3_9APHY
MSNSTTIFEVDNVPDPTDFPSTDVAPGLRELDEALRCSICGELFQAPLTVSCGHCFCSLCIRTQLAVKAECPLCRQSTSEFYLRKAQTVEDAVKAWNIARPYILQLCREEERRKAPVTPPLVDEGIEFRSPKKRKRSSTPDDEVVEIPKPTSSKNAQRSGLSPTPASGSSTPQVVPCPVCQRQVSYSIINQHLDQGCKSTSDFETGSSSSGSKGKQKQDWRKLFSAGEGSTSSGNKGKGKLKTKAKVDDDASPIPKVAYHTLKEKRLREMLADHDLPNNGDKDTLIKRHERWALLYNANLDRTPTDRLTLEDLRRELKKWETERQTKRQAVTDLNAYQKANKAAFNQLVEAARPKKPPTKLPQSDSPMSLNEVEEVPGSSSLTALSSPAPDPTVIVVDEE